MMAVKIPLAPALTKDLVLLFGEQPNLKNDAAFSKATEALCLLWPEAFNKPLPLHVTENDARQTNLFLQNHPNRDLQAVSAYIQNFLNYAGKACGRGSIKSSVATSGYLFLWRMAMRIKEYYRHERRQ